MYDETVVAAEEREVPSQINGKVRDKVVVPSGISEIELEQIVLARDRVQELLAGRQPYERATTHATLMAHVHEPIPDVAALRRDVPDALAALRASPSDDSEPRVELLGVASPDDGDGVTAAELREREARAVARRLAVNHNETLLGVAVTSQR